MDSSAPTSDFSDAGETMDETDAAEMEDEAFVAKLRFVMGLANAGILFFLLSMHRVKFFFKN